MPALEASACERINQDARQILAIAGTPECAVWVGNCDGWQWHTTIRSQDNDRERDNHELGHLTTYCIGSVTKVFVAMGAIILLEQLAEAEGTVYPKLHKLWRESISAHLDLIVKRQFDRDPALSDVLCHDGGLVSMNDFILGPDGKVLISKAAFLELVQQVTLEIHPSGEDSTWRYNNGGYILAGLLIEKYSHQELGLFLKMNLFDPLGMDLTFVDREAFSSCPAQFKSKAHVVSPSGKPTVVESPDYFPDTVVFAAMGIYSCTRDLAFFSKTLLAALQPGPDDDSVLTYNRAVQLCSPRVRFRDDASTSYTYGGCRTKLDSEYLGHHSLNHIVAEACGNMSNYQLSPNSHGQSVDVLYHGGTVTGYECSLYLLLDDDTFVIALSNATGLVDVSDHISRLILQELYLPVGTTSKQKGIGHKLVKFRSKKQQANKPESLYKIDIVQMARLGAEERRRYLERFQMDIDQASHVSQLPIPREGHYIDHRFRQGIFVQHCSIEGLVAYVKGDFNASRKFRMAFISDGVAILAPCLDEDLSVLGVDIFADWESLRLKICRDYQKQVTGFIRERAQTRVSYTLELETDALSDKTVSFSQ
ncbi:hypothetical protein BP6252_03460 [Coleophoma cylindrospora]|uniref:Beta-lactamase-related domain-containing protein n=1 Tax=Coleophoma cylindrospora TaxID=1849047 RepID=A0A3D8S981_9HELO|nr:hypothetical protein BP6252_03460 [Coleophoma cylindrospora]